MIVPLPNGYTENSANEMQPSCANEIVNISEIGAN